MCMKSSIFTIIINYNYLAKPTILDKSKQIIIVCHSFKSIHTFVAKYESNYVAIKNKLGCYSVQLDSNWEGGGV